MGTRYHYKLIEELGRGSAGVIYLALDVPKQNLVALKVLSQEAVDRHPNAVARFAREVRILSRLRHPNLVAIDRCGRSGGRPYFAMELIEGKSLASVLQDGPVPLRTVLQWTEKLARALDYVHRRGIVHRDLKPSNVLLDKEGEVRLADFGLARDEEDLRLTASGVAVGTLRYASPEQAGGDSHKVDGRADIYSLGLLAATAITGVVPRVPESMEDLKSRFEKEHERALIRLLVPEAVIEVLRRATRYDPKKRYKSARDLAGDVRELLDQMGSEEKLAAVGSAKAAAS